MASTRDNKNGNGDRQWRLTKEKILLWFGMALIAAEFVNAEVFGNTFHAAFLIGGFAACGIAIAQWGDKSGRK